MPMRQILIYFRSIEAPQVSKWNLSLNRLLMQKSPLLYLYSLPFQSLQMFCFTFGTQYVQINKQSSYAPGPFSSNLSNVAYTLLFFYRQIHFESRAKSCLIFTTIFTLKVAQQLLTKSSTNVGYWSSSQEKLAIST